MMDLPWWQESRDNEDLNLASEILDADHYGLEKSRSVFWSIWLSSR